jgi:hypothetical protein
VDNGVIYLQTAVRQNPVKMEANVATLMITPILNATVPKGEYYLSNRMQNISILIVFRKMT